jgi:hypothetical protein
MLVQHLVNVGPRQGRTSYYHLLDLATAQVREGWERKLLVGM